ncbi:MAG: acyl-CoA dehydrogenase family protein [Proteobacteria bacterium]|nr:acyl-CoA dehydrogenase family protein [Pseudomonadota bacterium]
MAIDFELSQETRAARDYYHRMASEKMRPLSRRYDEDEHEPPQEWIDYYWREGRKQAPSGGGGDGMVRGCVQAEELCWGDAGLYLTMPVGALGGAAVLAAGTREQQTRFLSAFGGDGPPIWGAMAITEASAGSDSAAIQCTARRDDRTGEWVINGTKIFCTAGRQASLHPGGFVVVWATLDRDAGRAGIKSFVVPAGTPGMKLVGLEEKLGIRASDTATLTFEDCRVPDDHLLGSAEIKQRARGSGDKGFRSAMATFDASRPIVAAMAIGVGRAALEHVKRRLEEEGVEIRYDAPPRELTAIERDVMEMEAELQSARLLCWRAAWMMNQRRPNSLEASMAKAKAGRAVTRITQKAVALLGPEGYSTRSLVEKWMRDAKINDIYEGTQQINQLIIARRILDYPSSMLR